MLSLLCRAEFFVNCIYENIKRETVFFGTASLSSVRSKIWGAQKHGAEQSENAKL